MVNMKRGKLNRHEKKLTLNDERALKREADELIRQTRRDMFNPARMTIRHIDQHEHEIDQQLEALEKVRQNVRAGHQEHHDLIQKKAELKTWKKRLRMARKAKKLGAKNEEIASALKEGERRHSHGPIKSLIGKIRHKHINGGG